MTAKQWLVPKYWQDFEEMCYRLYHAELAADMGCLYGRAGQDQKGVDIALRSIHREWTGIQCKLKTELLESRLTEKEVVEEHGKSYRFEPALTRLFLATTCPKDTHVTDIANRISMSFQSRHPRRGEVLERY